MLHAPKALGTGIDGDGTSIDGATHQHAINATFYRQCHSADVIPHFPRGNAANPTAFTHKREVDGAIVQRTATALLVNDLHLNKCHVGTIGLHTLRILDGGELQLIGLSCSLKGVFGGGWSEE